MAYREAPRAGDRAIRTSPGRGVASAASRALPWRGGQARGDHRNLLHLEGYAQKLKIPDARDFIAAATRAHGRTGRARLADLLIASIAAANGLPFYTRNPGDFSSLQGIVKVVGL